MTFLSILILFFVFLLASVRPVLGVFSLFALLPSYLLKIDILNIPTTVLELATYLVFVSLVINYFRLPDFREQVKKRFFWLFFENRKVVYVILFFMAVMFVATVTTVDFRRSAGVFKGWFFDPFLTAVMLFAVIKEKKQIYLLSLFTSLMMFVLSIHGIIEYINQDRLWQSIVGYPFRIDSIFTSANSFAMLAGPIIAFAFGLIIFNKDLRRKKFLFWTLVFSTLVNSIAFFLTFSYGAYLGLAVTLLWLSFMLIKKLIYVKSLRAKAIGFLAIVLIFLGSAFVYTLSSPKFFRDFYQLTDRSSLKGRMEIWGASKITLENDYLFGWGLGNYDQSYIVNIGKVTSTPLENVVLHSHNTFLNFWIEAGLLGLLSLLLFLYINFRLHGETRERFPDFSYPIASILLVLLVHGLLDTTYYKNDISYIFWLPLALLLFLQYLSKED